MLRITRELFSPTTRRLRRRRRRHRIAEDVDGLESRVLLTARVAGDFNGDTFDDLAIGVSGETIAGQVDAGAVNVIYGSAAGLTAAGNQFWHQNRPGIQDKAELRDDFGRSLAIGDFNDDGFDDLAIGSPGESVRGIAKAGSVHVLYGSAAGLTADDVDYWHQNRPGVNEKAEVDDEFGTSLIAGDFNGDGITDLGVGVPGESVAGVDHAGAVNILFGSAQGLTSVMDQLLHQGNSSGEAPGEDDTFGFSLAAGDFNGDQVDDLAVGVPREDVGAVQNAGAVQIYQGTGSGLDRAGSRVLHQNSNGINEVAETDDVFGAALAAGDFDGDDRDDLAVGVPLEDVDAVIDAGGVNIIYGGNNGLAAAGDQFLSQNTPGIKEKAESFDLLEGGVQGDVFGATLVAGDFDASGEDDLAVGVPAESIGLVNSGAVNVLYGSPTGLTATGNQLWHQNVAGIAEVGEEEDLFGFTLTAGNFDGRDGDELAIGSDDSVGPNVFAGAVNVIYSAGPTGLSSLGDQLWSQNSPGILDRSEPGDAFSDGLPGTRPIVEEEVE